MRSYRVPIVIEPCEEVGYYATCPSLPGCASQGETYLEVLANIQEAVLGYIESLIAHGDPVPPDTAQRAFVFWDAIGGNRVSPRFPAVTGDQVVRALRRAGFYVDRI
jgi:predicted RNase H-like HicB family nuclease